jgi:hypothetical protein
MEPAFNKYSDFIMNAVLNEHMTLLGLFLDLKTVNHFSVLSRYYNNILNNPKSHFGRMFWKSWAVKNGGIKSFCSSHINFKFKMMKKMFDTIKKNVKVRELPRHRCYFKCQNCTKECFPDKYDQYYFYGLPGGYCNCEFLNSKSKIEIIELDITLNMQEIVVSRRNLQKAIQRLDDRMEVLVKKEKKVKTIRHLEKMKSALQNVEQNDHYKETRKQAGKALKELKKYDLFNAHIRRNPNYNPALD